MAAKASANCDGSSGGSRPPPRAQLSTILLNVRWALIQTGRGATRAMGATNKAFAASFFACRIVVYARWLPGLCAHFRLAGAAAPVGFLWSIVALICGAFALNCYWMFGIVKMGLKGAKPKEGAADAKKSE